jgi:phage/plasmid-associated DNA primase
VTDWSAAYIADNDPLAAFVTDQCVVGAGEEVRAMDVWKAFDVWCDRNGHEKMSAMGFGMAFSRKYTRKSRASGNFYLGVRLKNITDATDDDSE